MERLSTIPGVDHKTAQTIVAEIGVDMAQFPSAEHLASWAGLCPGNNESAGKHKSGRTRKGDRWLRTSLVEASLAAMRSRDTYLSAHYRRVARRRGHKKAIVAVAHTILVIAHHLISSKTTYQELGGDFFERRNKKAIQRRCVRQLERLGLQVPSPKRRTPPEPTRNALHFHGRAARATGGTQARMDRLAKSGRRGIGLLGVDAERSDGLRRVGGLHLPAPG